MEMPKGMHSNMELVDTLIMDLNALPKYLIENQFIAACNTISNMGQKLQLLKNGISADLECRDKIIKELERQLKECGIDTRNVPIEEIVEKVK